jgi:hypothetical protein
MVPEFFALPHWHFSQSRPFVDGLGQGKMSRTTGLQVD